MTPRFDVALALSAALGLSACGVAASPKDRQPTVAAADDIEAGRYLTVVGGCNDCHTAGWNETGGQVPESERLAGVPVGWQGPWGVTYAANLRLSAASMDEETWVHMLRTRKDRPPMPWMNLNRMSEKDARAVYRYLRHLGPTGDYMPAGSGPGSAPRTPYIPIAPPQPPPSSAASAR